MANFVNNQIKFLLEVTTRDVNQCGKLDSDSPIDIKLNLNPDDKIITIDEAFSTSEDLIVILNRVISLLGVIKKRTDAYSEAIKISETLHDPKTSDEDGFLIGYEANFRPTFEKIDRIIFTHNSPGTGGVSYARSFNGDRRPSDL